MGPFICISLDEINRSEIGHFLNITVAKGDEREQLAAAVSEKTATALEAALGEKPFRSNKPGTYSYEV